jgi:hypothetical protein
MVALYAAELLMQSAIKNLSILKRTRSVCAIARLTSCTRSAV